MSDKTQPITRITERHATVLREFIEEHDKEEMDYADVRRLWDAYDAVRSQSEGRAALVPIEEIERMRKDLQHVSDNIYRMETLEVWNWMQRPIALCHDFLRVSTPQSPQKEKK